MQIAHDQGHGGFGAAVVADMAFKPHNAEVPPTRGKIGFGQLAKWGLGTHVSIIEAALIDQQDDSRTMVS